MTELTSRFADALLAAASIHAGQVRKGTATPYVAHLLGVASTVLELGGDEDEAIAALLHDALEDQPQRVTVDDVRSRFGSRVTDIVLALSDFVGPDADHKPPWHERKRAYLEHLSGESDLATLRVSLADKLYNVTATRRDLQAVGPAVWQRFKVGPADQLWYHDQLVEIFRVKLPGPLTEEYAATVGELHRQVEDPPT